MLFNSITYVVFLSAVYIAYRLVPHRQQNIFLLLASYIFYAWWDVRFLFLIIFSTVLNYCCGIYFREGTINFRQRIVFSAWLISAYVLMVFIQWNKLPAIKDITNTDINWIALINSPVNRKVLLAFILAVLSFNLLYPFFASFTEKRKRGLFLLFGISANLCILGFFKYFNFFIDNISWIISGLNMDPMRFHLNIILPIGVSFFTFKGISYIVDAYQNQIRIKYTLADFSLFIAFFPSILAGPIDRASSFLQQICEKRNLNWGQTVRGIHLFIYGLFKKIVIADGVVRTVASVFDSNGQPSWIDVVVATLLYTIQIYCDFSGYTDMARGTAKLFGIDLMVNFRLPYFSKNPGEFWRRWHISLSSWLRDYLYIPLGGNRKDKAQTYRNLIITMVLGGLWHGAAWNFVLWGLYHGIVLSIHRFITSIRSVANKNKTLLYDITKMALCFVLISYGWLLFRAPSLDKIVSLTSTLILDCGNLNFHAGIPRLAAILGLPIFFIIEIVENISNEKPFYQTLHIPVWTAIYAAIIFCIAIGMTTESAQFIYMVF